MHPTNCKLPENTKCFCVGSVGCVCVGFIIIASSRASCSMKMAEVLLMIVQNDTSICSRMSETETYYLTYTIRLPGYTEQLVVHASERGRNREMMQYVTLHARDWHIKYRGGGRMA